MNTICVEFAVQNGMLGNHCVIVKLDKEDLNSDASETEIIDIAFNKALNTGLILAEIYYGKE